MAGNIGSTATILFIVVFFLAGISFIAEDFNNNSMMNNESQALLSNLSSEYQANYKTTEVMEVPTNNVTNQSVFSGVDDFARQYLENKVEMTEKQSTIEKVLGFPGLFLKIFGVTNSNLLIAWNSLIYGLITFLIGLQVYKAIKTGEVDG